MGDDNLVKILFRFYSDILEEVTVETMWAEVVDIEKGYYKLNNIPFYAPLIASDDVVFAEYDEDEQMLTYRKTVEYSGNSTIHVIIMDDGYDINAIGKILEDMGCSWEGLNDRYFALEIPADIDYIPVKTKLAQMEKEEIISYAETSLSEKHDYARR